MGLVDFIKRRNSSDSVVHYPSEKKLGARVLVETEVSSLSTDEKPLEHVFQDPVVAEYYRQVYENTKYECRDYVDHDLTWTKEEERKIVRKNDWYVCFWAFVMFTALDFDRGNIQQALSDDMLGDLKLTTNDYNLGSTINLVCFLSAELPSQLISKWIGADIWIPSQLILWSIVSITQCTITTRTGFLVTRALLGALQGGFIPDVGLWMSYFYTSKEFPLRMSLFYIANPLTQVWSSLLAFALLKIRTDLVKEGWRWLFIVEGAFTLLIGIILFFKMPASVVQTKAWYRKKGWFTDREEKILVNKILRDDPSKGDMHNREPVGAKELVKTLLDYDLWPIYVVRFLTDIGSSPVSAYMTLTLRKLGFSTFRTNALSIPYNMSSIIFLVIIGYLTEVFNQRALAMAITPFWVLCCIIPLRFWPGAQKDVWGTYALLTVLLGHASLAAITITWCSANSNSVRTRAVSAALVNMFSQAAGICSANIYRKDDAPLYKRGNKNLIIVGFAALAACFLSKGYYIYRNKQKEKKWNSFTSEEREDYIRYSTDDGNKRLDFRFSH